MEDGDLIEITFRGKEKVLAYYTGKINEVFFGEPERVGFVFLSDGELRGYNVDFVNGKSQKDYHTKSLLRTTFKVYKPL